MVSFISMLLGMIGGAVGMYLLLERKRWVIAAERAVAEKAKAEAEKARAELSKRLEEYTTAVTLHEYQAENAMLKRDLANIAVTLRKFEVDHKVLAEAQRELEARGKELAATYLKDNIRWIAQNLSPNNYVACKQRLQKTIEWCRTIGYHISPAEEAQHLADLKREYEKVVRAAFEREEQARIRAQIREEETLKREIERELQKLAREKAAIQAALDKALAEAKDQHSAEIENLKARLAEAEARSQRALSQAQLTKAGHVYVISNIGSFGEGVFKIGVTRRLEPYMRVKELGDASVPFPFDVHMMIASDDAPALENALHRELHRLRINKVNPRKEFYRVDLDTIRRIVEQYHGEVQYVAEPEALEYRQSLTVTEEDQEFIEHVYDELDDEGEPLPKED